MLQHVKNGYKVPISISNSFPCTLSSLSHTSQEVKDNPKLRSSTNSSKHYSLSWSFSFSLRRMALVFRNKKWIWTLNPKTPMIPWKQFHKIKESKKYWHHDEYKKVAWVDELCVHFWCDIISFNNVGVNLVAHDNSYAIKFYF